MTSQRRTDVALDSNQDSMLGIHFDVTMLDMACDHVTVGVWDAFGTDRMNITKNLVKQRIDHRGPLGAKFGVRKMELGTTRRCPLGFAQ
ncbi:unnamed protein product [Effrenium voratum]|nr:unnamed protein product [Effrenium voratum]